MSIVPARDAISYMGTPPRKAGPLLRVRHRSGEQKSRRIFAPLGIEWPALLFALRRCRRVPVIGKVATLSRETGYSLISRETAGRESDQSPALPAKLVR